MPRDCTDPGYISQMNSPLRAFAKNPIQQMPNGSTKKSTMSKKDKGRIVTSVDSLRKLGKLHVSGRSATPRPSPGAAAFASFVAKQQPRPSGRSRSSKSSASTIPRMARNPHGLPGPTMAHWLAGLSKNNVDMYHPTARSAQECRTQIVYLRQSFTIAANTGATVLVNPHYAFLDQLYKNPGTPSALTPSAAGTINIYNGVVLGAGSIVNGGSNVTITPTGQYAASSTLGAGSGMARFNGMDISISQQTTASNIGFSVTSNSTTTQSLLTWDRTNNAFIFADQASFSSVDGSSYGTDNQGVYTLRFGPQMPQQMDFEKIDDWAADAYDVLSTGAVAGTAVAINDEIYPPGLGHLAPKGFTVGVMIAPFAQATTTFVITMRLVYDTCRYTPTADTVESVQPTVPNDKWVPSQPVHASLISDTISMARHALAKGTPGIDPATVVSRLGNVAQAAKQGLNIAQDLYATYNGFRNTFATHPKVVTGWAVPGISNASVPMGRPLY
jgi:hypothetical protein